VVEVLALERVLLDPLSASTTNNTLSRTAPSLTYPAISALLSPHAAGLDGDAIEWDTDDSDDDSDDEEEQEEDRSDDDEDGDDEAANR
jgi:hypothetical protein